MKITKNDLVRFAKFLCFSLGAGIIQIVSFTILNEVLHIQEWWLSHLPALVLSVLFNFTLNKEYTFKSADNVPKCMFLVFLFYLVFTPASTFGGQALANLGWDDFLVELLMMVANFVLEYLYCTFVVYRKSMDTKKK